MLNWYSPGYTNPAKLTVAGTPPMVAVTVLVVTGAPVKVLTEIRGRAWWAEPCAEQQQRIADLRGKP